MKGYNFSIERMLEDIYNPSSKRFFTEVYQTFVNGNYRSSVVMLYSVLICDLVYKLRDLSTIYGDSKASKILQEIEEKQLSNPTSPDWEAHLIQCLGDRTYFLEPSDMVLIESLKKYRNLSAHPILTSSDLLFSPSRETVMGLIAGVLEGVLTKPPILSNKAFDHFVVDLETIKDQIVEEVGLGKYLKSKYFLGLKEADFAKMFKSLWRLTFISDAERALKNRDVNFRAIKAMIRFKKEWCVSSFRSETDFFCSISKEDRISALVSLFATFPDFYPICNDTVALLLNNALDRNRDLKVLAWFRSNTVVEHINSLDPENLLHTQRDTIVQLIASALEHGGVDDLVAWMIKGYGKSTSWYQTGKLNYSLLNPIAKHLTPELFDLLLQECASNSQIHNRFDYEEIMESVQPEDWPRR